MDAATPARAPKPFFTNKRSGSGTGLGLAMAQAFAEQSSGALAIESQKGRGLSVTLWLPRAASEVASAQVALPATHASQPGRRSRIFLVDDEAMIREILARQLEEAGFDVLVASNDAEALDLSARETVDAVVTDLSMSGVDGFAVIRGIQARSPGLPAVLLTGCAGDEIALALSGAMTGIFSLLRKP
jgi:CheY-like chemotaxis protein